MSKSYILKGIEDKLTWNFLVTHKRDKNPAHHTLPLRARSTILSLRIITLNWQERQCNELLAQAQKIAETHYKEELDLLQTLPGIKQLSAQQISRKQKYYQEKLSKLQLLQNIEKAV